MGLTARGPLGPSRADGGLMTILVDQASRARQRAIKHGWKPRNCVWELTLACNLRCRHCGSSAGRPLPAELSTAECADVARQLAELGCELVTLSGGEPTLRHDWDVVARSIAERGMVVNLVTNGVYPTAGEARDVAQRARDAGLSNVGVSLDGPEPVNDLLRGPGTFRKILAAIEQFVECGVKVAVMTTVNQLNLPRLHEVRQIAIDAGAGLWRLQLAKPMGAMTHARELVLRPEQMLELVPTLAQLKVKGEIGLRVGDSIGYYGAHDQVLRGWGWRGRPECWQGCQAGLQAIGIEADGAVKGCLSLQACRGGQDQFREGNLRDRSLDELWHRPGAFAYNRDFDESMLTGACRHCRHGSQCRGGAKCVAIATSGTLTENRYCFERLQRERPRERREAAATTKAASAVLAISVGMAACGGDTQSAASDGSAALAGAAGVSDPPRTGAEATAGSGAAGTVTAPGTQAGGSGAMGAAVVGDAAAGGTGAGASGVAGNPTASGGADAGVGGETATGGSGAGLSSGSGGSPAATGGVGAGVGGKPATGGVGAGVGGKPATGGASTGGSPAATGGAGAGVGGEPATGGMGTGATPASSGAAGAGVGGEPAAGGSGVAGNQGASGAGGAGIAGEAGAVGAGGVGVAGNVGAGGSTTAAAGAAGSGGGLDCSAVCCECEYGVLPPDVLEQCCGVDPCATVCCDCDYGVIPEDYYAYCCTVLS